MRQQGLNCLPCVCSRQSTPKKTPFHRLHQTNMGTAGLPANLVQEQVAHRRVRQLPCRHPCVSHQLSLLPFYLLLCLLLCLPCIGLEALAAVGAAAAGSELCKAPCPPQTRRFLLPLSLLPLNAAKLPNAYCLPMLLSLLRSPLPCFGGVCCSFGDLPLR